MASQAGYRKSRLPRSPSKAFGFARIPEDPSAVGDPEFVEWGTAVSSRTGLVGAPDPKRLIISNFAARVAGL